MCLSERGLAALKREEGLRLTMYDDTGGACTIGYGHLVHMGRTGTNQQAEAPFVGGISENTASDLLRTDTHVAQHTVNRLVKVSLTQNQFDALTSLVYNIGSGAFEKSTLLRVLNAGDYISAARQFDSWCHDNGQRVASLSNRRTRERELFEGDV